MSIFRCLGSRTQSRQKACDGSWKTGVVLYKYFFTSFYDKYLKYLIFITVRSILAHPSALIEPLWFCQFHSMTAQSLLVLSSLFPRSCGKRPLRLFCLLLEALTTFDASKIFAESLEFSICLEGFVDSLAISLVKHTGAVLDSEFCTG
jgi:hypothetical protein